MRRAPVRPLLVGTIGILVVLAVGAPAAACPFCAGGPDGRNEVYEAIFNDSFWPTLVAAAAPFGLMLGAAALVWYGPFLRPETVDDRPT